MKKLTTKTLHFKESRNIAPRKVGMESNVSYNLARNLGLFFRPLEPIFVLLKHPRVALRAPLV